jgi:ligand-binding sensor domain-containing protein
MCKKGLNHFNKKMYHIACSTIIFFLLLPSLIAQPKFNFEYLDISNGLPHNTVFTILQDVNGYIWLGTQDGLVRYDSKNTKIYNRNTDSSFVGKNIQSLVENKIGDLFIGTRGNGIIVKSGRTGKFSSIANKELDTALSNCWIKHLMIDKQDRLWISTLDNGLWMYDQKTKKHLCFSKTNSKLNSNQISSTLQDKEGNIWIASNSEMLFVIKNETNVITEFPIPNVSFYGFRKTLFCDKLGRIWLGTEGYGLYLINPNIKTANSYTISNGLSSNTITHFAEWQNNQILIATDGGGLNILDTENQKIYKYKSQEGKFPLNTNALYCLHFDKDQNLWIGTYNGGVNISKRHKIFFETYQFDQRSPEVKRVKSILSIAKSSSNTLWIGTDGDGVYEYDFKNKTMKNNNDIFKTHSKTIKSIYEDSNQNLWLGVYNEGLLKYNLKTKQLSKYSPGQKTKYRINGWNVWSIAEDNQGNIWIATLGAGINKIDQRKQTIDSYVHLPQDSTTISGDGVMIVKFDHQFRAWIGTNTTGLNFLNPNSNRFKRFYHNPLDNKSISANDIRSIYQDSKKRVWVGTESGGLNLLLDNNYFKHFKIDDGLISNAVLAIVEDKYGNLWLSSFNGITRFDPNNNSFQRFSFHKNSSFGTNQFNMMSSYGDSTFIAFGGINGLTIFRPEEYRPRSGKPEVIYTDFKIFSKSADISKLFSKKLNAQCNIENAEEITLSYAENTFSFEFIAIDFLEGVNLQYEYKMEGFDKIWLKLNGEQREVSYTNLDPGTYTFFVKAASQNNQWGPEKKIVVKILPLYWQTWWFRIGALALLFSLASYILYSYLRNRELALNKKVLESNELILKITNEKLKSDQEILHLKNENLEMDILNKNSDLLSQTAKIAHKNEVLLNIKKLISEIDDKNEKSWNKFIRNLKSLIDSELEDKKNWERFQQYFDQINQHFSTNLLVKHPTLTQTDLLICTLSKLNLSNKEMAILLNLSVTGIEKSRYRLKKKLNLSTSEDLNTYLRSI